LVISLFEGFTQHKNVDEKKKFTIILLENWDEILPKHERT
jgi:hypothetical protein